MLWALTGLQAFGSFQGEYGRILDSVAQNERHATNDDVGGTGDDRPGRIAASCEPGKQAL